MSRPVLFTLSETAYQSLTKLEKGARSRIISDFLEQLHDNPKRENGIANPNGLLNPTADGSHKRSKNSDSEETKSEPPETTASTPSTTKSTTQPTQNILRKLTSSAQS